MPTLENKKQKQKLIEKARQKEKEYNIPENMLVGLLAQESGHFDKDVVSGKRMSYAKAKGVGQFMDATAKEYGIDPLNPDQAIDASAKYLSKSFKELGNWDDAILSYNAGVGRVKQYRAGKPIKIKEHAEYVGRVKKQIQKYGGSNYDLPQSQEQTNFDPIHYDNTIKSLNNLPQSNTNTTFAGVPNIDLPQEKTEEQTDKDVAELQTKTAEQNFLEELYQNREIVEQPQQVQQQKAQAQPVDYMQMYEQVSNFVDTPLIGGDEQMMQQGGKKTLYVNDKNDPRYRAYQDSLKAYNYSMNIKKQVEKTKQFPDKDTKYKTTFPITGESKSMLPKTRLEKLMVHPDSDPRREFSIYNEGTEKSMKPIDVLKYPSSKWYSLEAGTLPIYKKPTQPVEVRKKETTTSTPKSIVTKKEILPVEEKPREKLTPFNYDLELRGIQQNSLEPSSDLTIAPQAQIPRYYNITDKVNQNFGGSETKYRWNPNQGELPNISEETYPDGTPYNERKIEPVYQQGGKYDESRKWIQNWYKNREIPNQDIQNMYEEDEPFYTKKLSKIPNVKTVKQIDKDKRVTGRYNSETNEILMTPDAQKNVYLHEANHYINDFPSAMRTVHSNIVNHNIYKKDDKRLPKEMANKYEYFSNPDEVHSRIMVLRKDMGLKPNEKVEHKKLLNYLKNYKGNDTNILDIINLTDDRGLLDMLNYMAYNEKQTDNTTQVAQQGGEYSENELAFLSEIAIKDNQGQRKFPNQITEIQGDTMATNGYGNIPLYVIPDKGKPKVIQANTGEHKFKGATKFIEIPLFKK